MNLSLRPLMTACGLLMAGATIASAQATPPQRLAKLLPGTTELTWSEPLDVLMMQRAHKFIEQKIAAAEKSRGTAGRGTAGKATASETQRERLRWLLGAGNAARQPHTHLAFPPYHSDVRMLRIGVDQSPAILEQNEQFSITRVAWPVLEGVSGEGLLLEPLPSNRTASAAVVLVPDADQSPEQLAGLIDAHGIQRSLARQLAASGVRVVIPTLINRQEVSPASPLGQSNREWIYRQAFHMGRHILGYELDKIDAAVDWLAATQDSTTPIGIAGWGEGARLAFFSAALDQRLQVALVSDDWQARRAAWREPIYRNVWCYTSEFGDEGVEALIQPRTLLKEESLPPAVDATKDKAMPAGLSKESRPPYREPAVAEFAKALGIELVAASDVVVASDVPTSELTTSQTLVAMSERIAQRHDRQRRELDDYTQRLARDSAGVRDEFFLNQTLPALKDSGWTTQAEVPTTAIDEEFTSRTQVYRERFWNELLGKFDDPLLPPNPRTRLIRETDDWIAYDVVLDVAPELFAWGILMLPEGIDEGEKRPVIVVQHGRNGLPQNILDGGYNGIAAKLLSRGYIVFAPHNLYRGEDEYRWLDRKANSIGKTLFSFLLLQHDQITRWLAELPEVDAQRIAFYGNSYGGESAVRIPTVLTRYALSICASDFNDWTRKVTDTHDGHSFMRTKEWEMPYFNLGNTFSYAEMAYLMVPRPFMVERGHHDRVAPDSWVAAEYAKVRLVYDQLGIGERTAITFFLGGHTMRGEATLEFIEQQFR